MTGTNHALTGALIATTVSNPYLAIPLSSISHFVQDAVPHFAVSDKDLFKRKFNIILISDFALSVSLMVALALLFPSQKWLIWACMVAAAGPDLMWAYYRLYLERIKKKVPRYDPLAKFHRLMQWSQSPAGAYVEIVWFITILSTLLIRS